MKDKKTGERNEMVRGTYRKMETKSEEEAKVQTEITETARQRGVKTSIRIEKDKKGRKAERQH